MSRSLHKHSSPQDDGGWKPASTAPFGAGSLRSSLEIAVATAAIPALGPRTTRNWIVVFPFQAIAVRSSHRSDIASDQI
jgi:hypothetical protein